MGWVYAIIDEDKRIRYVGSTIVSPSVRVKQHWNGANNRGFASWKAGLSEMFGWKVLEEVDDEALRTREDFWTAICYASGCRLLNGNMRKAHNVIQRNHDKFQAAWAQIEADRTA